MINLNQMRQVVVDALKTLKQLTTFTNIDYNTLLKDNITKVKVSRVTRHVLIDIYCRKTSEYERHLTIKIERSNRDFYKVRSQINSIEMLIDNLIDCQ